KTRRNRDNELVLREDRDSIRQAISSHCCNSDSSSPQISFQSKNGVPAYAQAIAGPHGLRDSKISLRFSRASSSTHLALLSALPSNHPNLNNHQPSVVSGISGSR